MTTRIEAILIHASLIAAAMLFGGRQAVASVVICESQLVSHVGTDVVEAAWLESDAGASGAGSLVIDTTRYGEREPAPSPQHVEFSRAPAGMVPNATSLTQTGTGTGGFAVPSALESPVQDFLQATLSPESRAILPAGPVFRWFRPPRG